MSDGTKDEPVPVETLSYTEASRELDAIVNFFEQREVDVDVLVTRLERATALIDELDRRLRRTRAQVEELVPRLDALAAETTAGRETTMSERCSRPVPTGHGGSGAPDLGDRVYFRQLLSGRDFAQGDVMARQMVNFVYLIGDRETGEAVVVDPAYAVQDLLDIVEADGMRLTGVLGTHFHPDHLGGQMGGWSLEGISTLLEKVQVPVHVQADEVPWVERTTGVGQADLVGHHSGDVLRVGDVTIELIHTPGHTPGSQCFLVDGRLVAGDTLFLEGCGRTDFPGSDPLAMYESIHTRLARVPDDAILFPGHLYSADPSQSMGETRKWNYVFKPRSAEEWMAMFGVVTRGWRSSARTAPSSSSARRWPAGGRSRRCAREGFEGTISLVGEERHLPYDRPPLSKQVLAGTWPPEKAVLADKRRSSELRVHEVLGRRAVGLDAAGRKVELDDGTVLDGDGLVITTGAAPRRLPGTEGLGQRDGLFTLRTLDDSIALRAAVTATEAARVVVIGAGFIGAEVASTCADLGCRVTVLEALDIPLRPVLGPMLGEHCASLHRSHGVDLRLGVSVAAVRKPTAADAAPARFVVAIRRRRWWSSSRTTRRCPPTSSWSGSA